MINLSKVRTTLITFVEKNISLCEKLNRSQKFYYFGAALGTLSLFWLITPFRDIFFSLVVLSGLLLTFGVISDLLVIYKTVWETAIGKACLLLMYAFATNIAYAFAAKIVNDIVSFETTSLSYTTNFVAVLLVPFFVIAATYIIFMFVLIFGQIHLMIALKAEHLRKNKCLASILPNTIEEHPVISFIARLIAFPVVIGIFWGVGHSFSPAYESFIEQSASFFIYQMEATNHSRCKIPKNSKAIKVNESEIIVVEKVGDKFIFTPQLCIPVLEPNPAFKRDSPRSGRAP